MTAQFPEIIYFKGKKRSLLGTPAIPLDHPQIKVIPEKEAQDQFGIVFSTACWRHYIGTWRILDDKLFLESIIGRFKLIGAPLFADWWSGNLRIPTGKQIKYIHMGFESIYKREIHITIRKGVVTNIAKIKN